QFLSGRVDAVYVVVNLFRSVLSQIVHTQRLLPLVPEPVSETKPAAGAKTQAEAPASAPVDYLYEPNVESILAFLLPRYLEFMVYRALAESAAAEMGARMTAMDAATKNAGEMIDSLTLTYNRARQARITKELIEIVSGAAALEEIRGRAMAEQSIGKVVAIIGPVLDIEFPPGKLPAIYNAVHIEDEGKEGGQKIDVIAEVAQQLGENVVRCVSMKPTDGMVRGMKAADTGAPISVPVGRETLG